MVYKKSNGRQQKAESQNTGEADFLQDTLPNEKVITVVPARFSPWLSDVPTVKHIAALQPHDLEL